jgi:hypothetical protein
MPSKFQIQPNRRGKLEILGGHGGETRGVSGELHGMSGNASKSLVPLLLLCCTHTVKEKGELCCFHEWGKVTLRTPSAVAHLEKNPDSWTVCDQAADSPPLNFLWPQLFLTGSGFWNHSLPRIVWRWRFSPLFRTARTLCCDQNLAYGQSAVQVADSPQLSILHRQLAVSLRVWFRKFPNWHCTIPNWLCLYSTIILTWIPIQTTCSCQIQMIAFAYEQKYLYIANLINQWSNKFAIYWQKVKTIMNKLWTHNKQYAPIHILVGYEMNMHNQIFIPPVGEKWWSNIWECQVKINVYDISMIKILGSTSSWPRFFQCWPIHQSTIYESHITFSWHRALSWASNYKYHQKCFKFGLILLQASSHALGWISCRSWICCI